MRSPAYLCVPVPVTDRRNRRTSLPSTSPRKAGCVHPDDHIHFIKCGVPTF